MTPEEKRAYNRAAYKKWYAANKDKAKERLNSYSKKYRDKNKAKIKAQRKEYYEANKERIADYQRQWRKDNPDYDKECYQKNKETYDAYALQRREDNKLTINIYESCKRRYPHWKEHFTMEAIRESIGCSEEELRDRLGYDEETYGGWDANGMNIDHIIPLRTAETPEELLKLNHYSNLQLLSRSDNTRKFNESGDRSR